MWPPAKIITISAAPMASGGMTPAAPGMTVQPTVRTRKKVPMNSVRYLFMVGWWVSDPWSVVFRVSFHAAVWMRRSDVSQAG